MRRNTGEVLDQVPFRVSVFVGERQAGGVWRGECVLGEPLTRVSEAEFGINMLRFRYTAAASLIVNIMKPHP